MAKSKTASAVLEIPVNYGNINIGDLTARVGVTVSRKELTLSKADTQLCGKRLIGRIVSVPGNDNPEQPTLTGADAETVVAGAFDVKSVGFNRKSLSFGLTFSIESINIEDLAHFAKRAGKVVVDEITDIPESEDSDGAE